MIHLFLGIADFLGRLRVPSVSAIFGSFLKPTTVTSALTTFNTVIGELESVAAHHDYQKVQKDAQAIVLAGQATAHHAEAQSALVIAGKLKGLLA